MMAFDKMYKHAARDNTNDCGGSGCLIRYGI